MIGSKSHLRVVLAVAALSAVAGCTVGGAGSKPAAPAAPAEDPFEAGERAYYLGDPVAAIGLLEKVPSTHPGHPAAQDLLEAARADVAKIVDKWLRFMDQLIHEQRFRSARAYGRYLQQNFPLSADQKKHIEGRLERVHAGVDAARSEIEDLRAVADEQLLRRDTDGAIRTLKKAASLAGYFNLGDALEIERVIVAAQLRARSEGQALAKAGGRKGRSSGRKRRASGENGGSDKGSGDAGAPAPAPAPEPERKVDTKKVQNLLRQASRHRRKQEWHQAIVTYDNIMRQDAENETARQALEGMSKKRRELIRDYLKKANEHFVMQDLANAYPYFRKAQELDRDNEEAREGIEMYERLQRIRGQKR